MATHADNRFVFNLDWYDEQAEIIRKYQLFFYSVSNMIEMFDVKNQRIFLKKMEIPGLRLEDFYIGSKVTILSRVLKVTGFGDERTRR
jgi:nucleoside-diphosphate kinase